MKTMCTLKCLGISKVRFVINCLLLYKQCVGSVFALKASGKDSDDFHYDCGITDFTLWFSELLLYPYGEAMLFGKYYFRILTFTLQIDPFIIMKFPSFFLVSCCKVHLV